MGVLVSVFFGFLGFLIETDGGFVCFVWLVLLVGLVFWRRFGFVFGGCGVDFLV